MEQTERTERTIATCSENCLNHYYILLSKDGIIVNVVCVILLNKLGDDHEHIMKCLPDLQDFREESRCVIIMMVLENLI